MIADNLFCQLGDEPSLTRIKKLIHYGALRHQLEVLMHGQ
jgi:hypothetical protein